MKKYIFCAEALFLELNTMEKIKCRQLGRISRPFKPKKTLTKLEADLNLHHKMVK